MFKSKHVRIFLLIFTCLASPDTSWASSEFASKSDLTSILKQDDISQIRRPEPSEVHDQMMVTNPTLMLLDNIIHIPDQDPYAWVGG